MNTPLNESIDSSITIAKKHLQALELDKALEASNQSLELLIQQTDERYYPALVENYLLESNIYFQKKDFNQATNYADRALSICKEQSFKESEIEAYLLLGKSALAAKENILAIGHLLEAKEKSSAVGNQTYLAVAILYIGIVYNQVFHYPKALENLNLVENQHKSSLSTSEQILLLNYLGKSHFLSHQKEEALHYFLEAEKMAKKDNNKSALAFCLAFLGVISSRNNDFHKALRYAKRVNTITQQIGDVDGIQVNLINLGNVHSKLEKYSESVKLTSRGIAAAKRMKDGLSEIRGYQIMAEIFRKKKDFKSAVMYQMIYTKFYEDFYQRNDRQQVSEIEHQFTIQKLEQKIKALEKK